MTEQPETVTEEFERSVGFCNTCLEVIGPDWSEDVGEKLHKDHWDHDTEVLKKWTVEIEVPEEYVNHD